MLNPKLLDLLNVIYAGFYKNRLHLVFNPL